ncbi:MAG: tetratricopeptide repeat protein, partial [Acidobacteriota bacterium]
SELYFNYPSGNVCICRKRFPLSFGTNQPWCLTFAVFIAYAIDIIDETVMTRKIVSILLSVSLFLSGCAGKKAKVAQPPGPSPFEVAEKNYLVGNYTAAIEAYEQSLQQNDPRNRQSALFRLAVSYALRNASPDDLARSKSLFDLLIREYPSTPLADQAKLLSSSVQLVRELEAGRRQNEEQLQRLSGQVTEILQRIDELEKRQEAERNDPLRRAGVSLRDGNVKKAAEIYQAYLSTPNAPNRDEAAFRLALIQLSQEAGLRDSRLALNLLDRILKEWPESPYAPQARHLLSVHRELARLRSQVENQQAELKQLSDALNALKAIDLKRR